MATPAAVLSILVQAQGLDRASRQIRGLDSDLDRAGKTGSRTGSAIKKAAGLVGGIVAFDTLRRGVGAAVGEFEEARKVGAQTTNVIKSTGGAANVTAKQVATLASSISKKVGIDDEAIQSGANLLLTFKNVRNELGRGNKVFDRATKAAVDLSAAGFGDLSSTSKQLGKALNDPIKGLTSLTRSGVTFTEKQKERIVGLAEEGKTLKAQKIILKEVESQVKGSAAAQATSFDHLRVTLGNLAEAAGAVLVPAFDKVARFATMLINQMIEGKSTGGAIISVFKGIGVSVGTLIGAIRGIVGWFRQHETVTLALGAALGVVLAAFAGFKILAAVQAAIMALRAAMLALNLAFLANPVVLVVAGLAALVAGLVVAYQKSETFRNIVNAVGAAMKDAAVAVVGFVTDISAIPDKLLAAGNWIVGKLIEGVKAMPAALLAAATWIKDRVIEGIKAYVTLYLDVGKWLVHRLVEGVKAIPGVLLAMAGWVKDRFIEGIKVYLEAYKALGGWVLRRLVDGIKALPDLVIGVGGWVKNRIGDGLRLVVDGITGLGNWVIHRVVEGIKATPDFVMGVGEWIKNRLMEGLKSIVDGVKGIGGWIIERIVDGLKGGANLLVDFLNDIIGVINKLPGVSIGKIEKFAEGGKYKAFARGGAYARTGGLVDKPMALMGEEAPRHPEFVIPTNPAYRKRAQQLLAQAAGAVGFQAGGVYNGTGNGPYMTQSAIEGLARQVHMSNAHLMSAIAMAESAGEIDAFGPPSGKGLWQIEWNVWANTMRGLGLENPYNPMQNALMARHIQDAQGLGAWVAYTNGNYQQFMGGGQRPVVGALPGIMGDLLSKGAGFLLDQLPSADGLGWLKGTGKYILDKVTGWIKDKVQGLIGVGDGGGNIPKGIAGSVQKAIQLAMGMGFPMPSSGQLTGGQHAAGSLHYAGKAVDFGHAGNSPEKMQGLWRALIDKFGQSINELFFDPMPWYIDAGRKTMGQFGGHADHIHAGFFRKGGVFGGLPFLGSYHAGGVAPYEGLAHVSAGERMTPAGQGLPEIHVYIGDRELTDLVDVRIVERDRHTSRTYRAGVAPA